MNCIIIETGSQRTLSIVDPSTGVDYAEEFIGKTGGADQFVWNEDRDAYEVGIDTYKWWAWVVEETQALEDRLFALHQKYGWEAVYK